jgi:hypothetical protein
MTTNDDPESLTTAETNKCDDPKPSPLPNNRTASFARMPKNPRDNPNGDNFNKVPVSLRPQVREISTKLPRIKTR